MQHNILSRHLDSADGYVIRWRGVRVKHWLIDGSVVVPIIRKGSECTLGYDTIGTVGRQWQAQEL
jgi:hypothetical protein